MTPELKASGQPISGAAAKGEESEKRCEIGF